MKKTQLRKIIRESIKELIKEQPQVPCDGSYIRAERCDDGTPLAVDYQMNMKIGGQIPSVNDVFYVPLTYNTTGCDSMSGVNYPPRNLLQPAQEGWYKVTSVNPPQLQQNSIVDLPVAPNPPQGCGGTSPTGCTQQEFSWSSQCSIDFLDPAPGGPNSWNNWLNARWNGFNNIGCQHIQNVINWNTNQLSLGTTWSGNPLTQVQIDRKTAQIAWAGCMQTQCSC